jgi:hypothetical protein
MVGFENERCPLEAFSVTITGVRVYNNFYSKR